MPRDNRHNGVISTEVWLSTLTGKNFMAVYNVVSEARQQSQLSDKAEIDLRAEIIGAEDQVLPQAEIADVHKNSRELQWKAIETLCDKQIFSDVIVIEGSRRWPIRVCV